MIDDKSLRSFKGASQNMRSHQSEDFGNMELMDKAGEFFDINREEDIPGGRKPFSRDDFRYMINKTYLEFYGKFKDQFNPEEYI